ncbi:MAG: hypothetical protein VX938_09065, partial [Myxococcota bacterium]|nr:hypothetical protein [Myxococcota bacterium]
MRAAWVGLVLGWGVVSCGTPESPTAPLSHPPPVPLACNVVAEACTLPFPSSVLSVPDDQSSTGLRVSLSDEADFAGFRELVGSPSPDGFSFAGGILTVLRGPVDPESLPGTYEESLAPDASIRLLRLDGASPGPEDRVPFRAEVVPEDEDAPGEGTHLLVITPRRALEPSGRYGVLLTSGLLGPDGDPHQANDAMT